MRGSLELITSKPLVFILLSSFLVSCTASQHAGILKVTRPALTETDEAIWYAYYEDQFDGYDGKVVSPGAEYPEAARRGYERAMHDWDGKNANALVNTFLISIPIGVAIGLLIGPSIK